MDKKAKKGYLIGYDGDERYRVYIKEERSVIVSRDVVFNEKLRDCDKTITLERAEQDDKPSDEPIVEQDELSDDDEQSSSTDKVPERTLRVRKCLQIPKRYDDYILEAETFVTEFSEPETYEEALDSSDKQQWVEAMHSEIVALHKNQTCVGIRDSTSSL
jgi:hypothetical protein